MTNPERQPFQSEERVLRVRSVRAEGADGQPTRLVGHAAVFDQVTTIQTGIGDFDEVVRPGAFAAALAERQDVVACIGHGDEPLPLGRTSAGTLRLWEDGTGLAFENLLPPTSLAVDLIALVKRGDMGQMSFRFSVRPGGDRWTDPKALGARPLRELLSVNLADISYVVTAAYPGTDAALRSATEALRRHNPGVHHTNQLAELAFKLTVAEMEALGVPMDPDPRKRSLRILRQGLDDLERKALGLV